MSHDLGHRLMFQREGGYVTAHYLLHNALRPIPERLVLGAMAADAFERSLELRNQFISLMQQVAADVALVRTGQRPLSWEKQTVVEQPPAGEETKH